MKATNAKNGLLLFLTFILLGSCFEAPDFSPVPRIKFENIYFGKSRIEGNPDSLVISISFEDGDGNLGLPQGFREDPYHEQNFFIASNGNLSPVGRLSMIQNFPRFLNVPESFNGKLAVLNTRRDPQYTNKMVSYTSDSACLYYNRFDSVLLKTADKRLIDESYNYYEVNFNSSDPAFNSYIVVKDTFYVEKNPNYQNIDVRFYRKIQDPNDPSKTTFTYVNWSKIYCTEIFDARFPVLSSKQNALSGTINYSMTSTELESMMGNFIWKIRVQIRDRAFNASNIVESREFTLDEIRRQGG